MSVKSEEKEYILKYWIFNTIDPQYFIYIGRGYQRIQRHKSVSLQRRIQNSIKRPPTRWNLEKKNDGQAGWAWPSSAFGEKISKRLDGLYDLAEHVTNCRTKDRQNDNDNDGDKNQNQCVLYKTLAFPLQFLEHGIFLLS
jgi:hypothetical protein